MSRMPDEEADDRPWERPGAFRLDCEPHRGGLLCWLGLGSYLLGFLSLFLLLPSLGGLPLGVAVWRTARRDLARMGAGLMDARGQADTEKAKSHATIGVELNLVGLALLVVCLVYNLLPRR
jgi:hypothetical protein